MTRAERTAQFVIVRKSKRRVLNTERYVASREEQRPDSSRPDGLGRVPSQNSGKTRKVG